MKTLTITINIPLSDDPFEQADVVSRSKMLPEEIQDKLKVAGVTGTVTPKFVTKREKKAAATTTMRETAG